MNFLFSPQFKYTTWRKLWIALAKGQKRLGLAITSSQLQEMQAHAEKIDLSKVKAYEKTFRHDVMAHLHAFAEDCPSAKKILHLGATSAFITDNTDLIQMQKGLLILQGKGAALLTQMRLLAKKYAALPTVGYTHFQPAQPTSVGKRICLWLQDLLLDCKELTRQLEELAFLGVKGATGTQASFMHLFDFNSQQVSKLDHLIAKEFGFQKLLLISGQTYSRKQDMQVVNALAGLAASSHKIATDLRLLSHLGELEEPHEVGQVGSSAMPHKRNPILAERLCSLARYLLSLSQNPPYTFALQWLERSLDDSANRRMCIPEAFLTADALLNILFHIFSKLKVYPKEIEKNLKEQQSLLSLENILMLAAKKGFDRQIVHEKLRNSPSKGEEIAKELHFTQEEIKNCFMPEIGRAEEQVAEFLKIEVDPFLKKQKKSSHILFPKIEI